jgi:RNA polymerase sigma-70 factor (ECF subfamily)
MSELTDTAILINRIKAGDSKATDELVQQCYPILLKWAHGRIPYSEKSLLETTDIVQESILRGIQHLHKFKALKTGAFLAYLRKIFINCINESVRKPNNSEDIDSYSNRTTYFSTELDVDDFIYYETALNKLSEAEQQAIILRVEFGFSYNEIAKEMDKNSEDAARMFVSRAMIKLAEYLKK